MFDLIRDALTDGEGLSVDNPATGAEIARVRAYGPAEVEPIIVAADRAGRDWAKRTAKDRAVILRRWFDAIMAHQEELARLMTLECGKPIAESRGEVAYGASFIEWFAEEGKRAYGEVIPTHAAGKRILTLRQPVGTCAAITPWNFPLAMITRKAGPALAAGCAMVVKPAEATPLTALALEVLAHEAGIPRDLFRILPTTDAPPIGALFCAHPLIRKISFTGSTPVGKRLMADAAATVKRVSMELGGNAPFIVFDDADIDAAVDGFMVSKFRNAGQTCVCANRLLVQTGIADAFVRRLTARVAALQVGNGLDDGVAIGPLISDRAVATMQTLIADATASGALLTTGGKSHPAGQRFFTPTVLDHVTPDMAVVTHEIFGPIAPVIRFETEAEAIRIANDTPFGLAAYAYTRDIGRVWRVTEALEYGMVAINEGILSTEVAPFGGVKESGVGREGSRHGLGEYLEIKYALMGGIG